MNTTTKHQWFSLENKHTGEPEGLLCSECRQGYPFKYGIHEISCSEINWNVECSCCHKNITEDYVQCGECLQIYPKGEEDRVENGMKCFACSYGI